MTLTEHALHSHVTSGQFAPVYYLYGDDDFRKDEAVTHLVASAVPASVKDFNVELKRGSDLDSESITSLLDTPPMMADRRVVVIRDVTALKKDTRKTLDQYLKSPAKDSVVVLTAPSGAKADTVLMAHATAVEFPALTDDRVAKWIVHRAKEMGATITPEASSLLFEAGGSDLASLSGELDKLVSYVRGSSADQALVIDDSAITAVVGVRRGESLGDLLDHVAARDAAGALALLPHVMALPKTTAVSIVMALTTQTLALAWGVSRRSQGVSAGRLPNEYFGFLRDAGGGAMTGRPWGEAVNAWGRSVDAWTLPELDRALEALLAADIALKDTRVSSDEQLLTSLMLTLCHSRKPNRSRRAAGVAILALCVGVSGHLWAQSADSAAVDSAVQRAQAMVSVGNVSTARALLDSLVTHATAGTPEYADVLYARAGLAMTATEAEHDYRQIIAEYPSSPNAALARTRLTQLDSIRGQPAEVLPVAPTKAVVAKPVPTRPTPTKPTPTKPTPISPIVHAGGKYTVQVAAYDDQSDANALAAKLRARGDSARVWGTSAPYRVRIGHYPTWAAADTARKALVARHMDAFVTETEP